MPSSEIILSGFADEAAVTKTAVEQLAVMSALGLRYYSLRFVDVGGRGVVTNMMKLNQTQVGRLIELNEQYDMEVATLGTPIGKTKLFDLDDGSKDKYVPFQQVLEEVKKACGLAHRFGAKIIRGFTFYPPQGANPEGHTAASVQHMGSIAEVCGGEEVVYAAEVEARLTGRNGSLLAEIHKQVNHSAFFTCLDLGNLHTQGYSTAEVLEHAKVMMPSVGLFHIKDYAGPMPDGVGEIDEDALKHFVPADEGGCGHTAVMQVLRGHLPAIVEKLKARGVPGLFCDMEPHLKGGGQFGGFSGPDGMGVALRAFCQVCDSVGVGYKLRDFGDVKRVRGY